MQYLSLVALGTVLPPSGLLDEYSLLLLVISAPFMPVLQGPYIAGYLIGRTELHLIWTSYAAVHRQPQLCDGCYPACYLDGFAVVGLIAADINLVHTAADFA